jgi:ferredoxin
VGDTTVAARARLLDDEGFARLLAALARDYDLVGPTVRDGAIVLAPVGGVGDLPRGIGDEQSPGRYRLVERGDDELFGWAVGPESLKRTQLPATQELWRLDPSTLRYRTPEPSRPSAVVGLRPCDVAAASVLSTVLTGGDHVDPVAQRAADTVVVAVECGRPAATCFCTSMGTGPSLEPTVDVVLTELAEPHRFLARAGTARGAALLDDAGATLADDADADQRDELLARAAAAIRLAPSGMEGIGALVDHPRWADVADRCLSCGNCTMVCPTCFCTSARDVTDLAGEVTRRRDWSSCFDLDHSYIHGGPVRASVSSRYRQWATHKLSTWFDQFGTSGCVGCGRCVAWCPVGIDIVEEAAALVDGGAP